MHMHDWVNEWVAHKWMMSELLLCWTTSSPLRCLFSKLFLLWAASYRGDFFTDPLLLWVLRPPCAATRACAKSKTLCLAAVNLQQKSGSIRDAFLPAATPISLVRKSFLTRFCTVWCFLGPRKYRLCFRNCNPRSRRRVSHLRMFWPVKPHEPGHFNFLAVWLWKLTWWCEAKPGPRSGIRKFANESFFGDFRGLTDHNKYSRSCHVSAVTSGKVAAQGISNMAGLIVCSGPVTTTI